MSQPLLTVNNLSVTFNQDVPAVDDVSFTICKGKTFALVGESGSGKSVTALAVLRLLSPSAKITAGQVHLADTELLGLSERKMGKIRGKRIGIIFQDPMTSLNPVLTIAQQIEEVLKLHHAYNNAERRARVIELLLQVGLPNPEVRMLDFPHQLSGGQRQRVMIAIALAGEPDLLIADEPTTALDVTIQAQVLALIKTIQQQTGMALWIITHDLGLVETLADDIAVMRHGKIVDSAPQHAFFTTPRHEYTQQLFNALPKLESCRDRAPVPKKISNLIEVRDYRVYYPIRKGLFKRVVDHVRAVDGININIKKGSTLALVGESGCGKSTLGKSLLQLIPVTGGSVHYQGMRLNAISPQNLRRLRSELQIIFQDPFSAMNPRMLVGDIIAEGMLALLPQLSRSQRKKRIAELLDKVGLPQQAAERYPHEFSGGQRQRICIARALAIKPKLIVCDEPTSALDVSVQAQIIALLKQLQKDEGLSYLFISHDLAVVAELADEVAVMQNGQIVENGPASQVLLNPQHEYTQKLLASLPSLHQQPQIA